MMPQRSHHLPSSQMLLYIGLHWWHPQFVCRLLYLSNAVSQLLCLSSATSRLAVGGLNSQAPPGHELILTAKMQEQNGNTQRHPALRTDFSFFRVLVLSISTKNCDGKPASLSEKCHRETSRPSLFMTHLLLVQVALGSIPGMDPTVEVKASRLMATPHIAPLARV